MKNLKHFLGLLLFLSIWISCKKDEDDAASNTLGGDTNIPLTAINLTSTVYGSYGTQAISGGSMKVIKNDNGRLTYEAILDMSQFPDTLLIQALTNLALLSDYYKFDTSGLEFTADGKLKYHFDMKVTSEGWLDYSIEGKPWIIGKYNDNVGTKYTLTRDNGQVLTRTITEKTGLDEWPLGPFFLIKTSKIESESPADDPVLARVIYRINHRFGLVYMEYQFKDGTVLELNILAPV
jgi:hypothetical protein